MEERAPEQEEPIRTLLPRRILREEVLVVLSVSLAASAVFAIIDLLSAPIKGVAVATFPNVQLATQLADIAFGLAPVWLVVHLLKRTGEGVQAIGYTSEGRGQQVGAGVGLAGIVGGVGLGLYLAAVALGVNRIVYPIPPEGHWWTIPVLVLGSAQFALLEETITIGYLLTRLPQLGWNPVVALFASAVFRGSYHLYQGWGGFAANCALGVFFGFVFLRWRRLWPLVIAHFLVDVSAGIGYLLFKSHLPGL